MPDRGALLSHQRFDAFFADAELSEHCFGETKRPFRLGYQSVASAGTAKSRHVAQPARPHDDT